MPFNGAGPGFHYVESKHRMIGALVTDAVLRQRVICGVCRVGAYKHCCYKDITAGTMSVQAMGEARRYSHLVPPGCDVGLCVLDS